MIILHNYDALKKRDGWETKIIKFWFLITAIRYRIFEPLT